MDYLSDFRVLEREHEGYDINMHAWAGPHPFGISGCFRLRNETEFMRAAIISHLSWLDEAVLVVQPSDDATPGLAAELMMDYPDKVRVVIYPFVPHWIDHPDFPRDPVNSIHSLVYFSNWALSQCSFSWIAKTEGDVVCLSSFGDIVKAIQADRNAVRYYGRYILNLAGSGRDEISMTKPRNHGLDEAVFNNDPNLFHFEHGGRWEVVNCHAHPGWIRHMGYSAFHMKRCKARYAGGIAGETWASYTRQNVDKALSDYETVDRYLGPDYPPVPECLFERIRIGLNEIIP
jgi:hypothetical protein